MNTTRDPSVTGTHSKLRRRPSPALVLAMVALFAALAGGATAGGIVGFAKHAATADSATVAGNAKRLGGKTAAQIAASVHGATGPQGPAGLAGAAGATGPAGAKGDAGGAGPAGPAGPKGDVGAGLKIVGTVASQSALPTTGTTGDAYLVGGDLFVWTGTAWTNAGPVQGPKGDKGDKGDTGATGPQGIQGVPGTAAVSIHTQPYSVAANSGVTITGACTAGQKAVNGGFDSLAGTVFSLDSKPTPADDGWQILLVNADVNPTSGNVYAVCMG